MSPGLAFAVDAGWLLVPAALLCAMFCARLGVERGRALARGILPGLLVFCAVTAAAGWVVGIMPQGHTGWPLLAAFAVLRADPPAPVRVGVGWTLAAGVMVALGAWGWTEWLGGIGALGLYVWWSAGGRRAVGFMLAAVATGGVMGLARTSGWPVRPFDGVSALTVLLFLAAACLGLVLRRWQPPGIAPTDGPETPGRVPMAASHRMVGGLIFFAWMGVPGMIDGFVRHECPVQPWENVLLPLGVALGLMLTDWLERRRKPILG